MLCACFSSVPCPHHFYRLVFFYPQTREEWRFFLTTMGGDGHIRLLATHCCGLLLLLWSVYLDITYLPLVPKVLRTAWGFGEILPYACVGIITFYHTPFAWPATVSELPSKLGLIELISMITTLADVTLDFTFCVVCLALYTLYTSLYSFQWIPGCSLSSKTFLPPRQLGWTGEERR